MVGLTNRDAISRRIDTALRAGARPAAPALTLPVLVAGGGVGPVGTPVALRSLRGRVVVLNVWASWCDTCKAEAAVVEGIWRRVRPRGALVLGLDNQDPSEKALAFARHYQMTYPSVRDGTDGSYQSLEMLGVPETFVIDRQGRIALAVRGELTASDAESVIGVVTSLT